MSTFVMYSGIRRAVDSLDGAATAITAIISIDATDDEHEHDNDTDDGDDAISSGSGVLNGLRDPSPPSPLFSDSSHDLPDEWCTHPSVSAAGSNQFYERLTCRICGARCCIPRGPNNRGPRDPRHPPRWP
jgi:hypothetical protein